MTVTYVHKFLKKKPYRTDIRCKPARRKLVCLCIPTFPAFIVTLEAFSELLEVLYSAPLQQEPWERFLALLTRQTQAEGSFLICASSRQSLSVSAQGGSNILDDVGKLVYKEKFAPSDPFRAPALRFGRSGVVQDEDLLPNEGLLARDMYRYVLAPKGYRYATLLLLAATLRRLEAISIYRSIDRGPMDADNIRLLNLLLPHVQKAMEIRQVLGAAQQRAAGAEAMANASATPTFLLTGRGGVLHCNAAAEKLLGAGDALTVRDGVLATTQTRFKERLSKLLLKTASAISPNPANRPPNALALPRSGGLQALQLIASPLPPAHRNRAKAAVVLLVTDPDKPINFPDDVLHALYGLTPAQTEVANGLLTGYTLEEIATLRRVSLGTVRQQVKGILGKTQTNRQSDLIRLLMTLHQAASAN